MKLDVGKMIIFGFITFLVIVALSIYSGILTYDILSDYLVEEEHKSFNLND
ncbi:hypothetical protein [Ureibacillus massiliensis]|uniref:hypothetical protein n=1 Tax=Ureibacillus massiliensis TaxID=292806 RepID=UPI000AE55D30|nr:hypothetical protein [Ureibacillus massiliensis]